MKISHHQQAPRRAPGWRRRYQQGYVLVMFALLLVPMLFVAGLSVDVGLWYNKASDMRKAADAAALAGVVWLPDENAARGAALVAAERNGFPNGGNITVSVTTSAVSDRRIKVTITDSQVGSFFYQNLGGRKIPLTRTAFAEYVLAVPMGSPRNYFGTGRQLGNPSVAETGVDELLYLAINTYCTNKVQGDRHQTPYINLGSGSAGSNVCGGTVAPDASSPDGAFRPAGYQFVIEAPENRAGGIEVRLFDPRFNATDAVPNNVVVRTECTYPWGSWSGDLQAGWGGTRLDGPVRYRTWNSRRNRWNDEVTLNSGENVRLDQGTWYQVMTPTGPAVCVPVYGTENPIDTKNNDADETFYYELAAPDNTPLNDTDNPVICSASYDADTPFAGYTYLGSVRWNTLCTIPASADPGRYILRARNPGTNTNGAVGVNNWGVVAKYTTSTDPGLCDGRTDITCPRVYAKDAMSVYANSGSTTAEFFLAEIPPEHAGKKLVLELYDAGEGGRTLEILGPNGADSFTARTFDYYAKRNNGTAYGGRVDGASSIDITGSDDVGASKYNAKVIYIEIDLAGYNPPTNNHWWKIRYQFNSGVTDRTTWSARIEGDPIHLVEEF